MLIFVLLTVCTAKKMGFDGDNCGSNHAKVDGVSSADIFVFLAPVHVPFVLIT